MAAVRIAPEQLLHPQRQAVKALAHVGMTGRQPDPCAAWDRDHHRRLLFATAFTSAATVEASTVPVIRIRPPASASKNASKTPDWLSRQNLFQPLSQLPNSAGSARHVMLWTEVVEC